MGYWWVTASGTQQWVAGPVPNLAGRTSPFAWNDGAAPPGGDTGVTEHWNVYPNQTYMKWTTSFNF